MCESWKRYRKADTDALRVLFRGAIIGRAPTAGERLEKYPKHLTAFTWKLNDSISVSRDPYGLFAFGENERDERMDNSEIKFIEQCR